MSSPNYKKVITGIGGLMFLVFFVGKVLELGPFATWSWWWVTAPWWGPIALGIGVRFAVDVVTGLFRMTAGLFR